MIRALLWLLATITATWFVADAVKQHGPGYVLVYFNHYSLETSVWVAILLLFALVFLFYLLVRLLHGAGKLAFLGKRHRYQRFLGHREHFIAAMLEEDWTSAVRAAEKSANSKNAQSLDELMAIKAALSAGTPEIASAWLKRAIERDKLPQPLVSILRYDLLCQQQENDRATLLLESLLHQYGSHMAVLQRAVTAFCQSRQYSQLQALLPDLAARMPHSEHGRQTALLVKVAACLFEQATTARDNKLAHKYWKRFAKSVAKDSVLPLYCRALIALGEEEKAEKMLLARLDKGFAADCLVPFAQLQHSDRDKQCARLEALQAEHDGCAELQLALGIVYLRALHLEDARQALEKSLALKPDAEAWRYLALYYDKRNDYQHARQVLEKAIDALSRC